MAAPSHFPVPTRPDCYLPEVICTQLYMLDEIAEQFLDHVNYACLKQSSGSYQIASTSEWNYFQRAVTPIIELRGETEFFCRPYDINWCRDHMRLLQACKNLVQIPYQDKDGDILKAGEYVLKDAIEMPEIAFIFHSLKKATNNILQNLHMARVFSKTSHSPAP